MIKSCKRLILLLVLLLLCTSPAYAFEIGSSLQNFNYQESKLAWQISEAYQLTVSPDHLAYMHYKLSYAETVFVYGLSDASGKDIGDIYAMRVNDGMIWRDIVAKLGVNPENILPTTADILHKAKLDAQFDSLKTMIATEQAKPVDKAAKVKPDKEVNPPPVTHAFSPSQN
jgi:hypothetical protein